MADEIEEVMMRELHLEERPESFKQVVGQDTACKQLVALAKGENGIPHCLLFTGPSGCGKTTLARIVRNKLECSDADFAEVNAANDRGVDMVRSIQTRVGLAPMQGKSRVWLVDECHQLTGEAQGAFLKLLEEPPNHVYFMLATTNPEKLREAIKTRCTEIKVRALTDDEVIGLANRVFEERVGHKMTAPVATKLAEVAGGSARKALVLLQQIMGVDGEDDKINTLQNADSSQAAIEIARALMARKDWSTVAPVIKACGDEPEGIRRLILAYFSSVALGGGKQAARAVAVMEEFQYNYFDTGKPGLVMSAFRACSR